MSVDKPGRMITIWDIEFEGREAVKTAIEEGLAAFDQHKEALLAILREVRKRDLKSEPFDADKSWRDLTRLAQLYFERARTKQETIPAGDRVKRLDKLAKALDRAHAMADKAMRDDVGNDLFSAWWDETYKPGDPVFLNDDGSSVLTRIADEIKKAVAGLATLETAARTAVHDVRLRRGAPEGIGVLPPEYVIALAEVYRKSTGLEPDPGDGRFAQFVREFLVAIGQHGNRSDSYVVEMIKYMRKQLRKNPKRGTPFPFDK